MPNLLQRVEAAAARGAAGLLPAARAEVAGAVCALQCAGGGFAGLDGRPDAYYSFFAWLCLRALGGPYDRGALREFLGRGGFTRPMDARCAEIVRVREGWRSPLAGWLSLGAAAAHGESRDPYGAFLLGMLADTLLPGGVPRGVACRVWRRLALPDTARAATPRLAARAVLAAVARQEDEAATEGLAARRAVGGGYASAAGAAPDLLATAAARFALAAADTPAGRRALADGHAEDLAFIEACWLADGLFGPSPDARSSDAEHTFYGLLALGTCRDA